MKQSNRPFPSSKNLTFKARLSAKPLTWKWFLIMMQIKLIFTTKVSHLASFWKWDFLELGNGQFKFTFQVALSVCCHPGNLPPWQHDIKNSPFYLQNALCISVYCLFVCVLKMVMSEISETFHAFFPNSNNFPSL